MADALLEMGMQVDILAWDRSQNNNCCNTEQFPSGTAQVTRFGIPATYGARWATLLSFLHFEWSLLAWLMRNRRNYDIIHAFDLDTGFVAWLSSKLYRKKLVFHILDSYADTHFFSDSIIKRMVHKMEMALINSAEATLICTEERKAQIQNIFAVCQHRFHKFNHLFRPEHSRTHSLNLLPNTIGMPVRHNHPYPLKQIRRMNPLATCIPGGQIVSQPRPYTI
jgi:hypothetical protein